ncbi:hypothetical protein B9Z65_7202 [Elsinoe australis]|uniref:Asl1-like glycosyl hydrolase catalytic domain-containing protein n=1 Tax=Elsinoe australis TaxID=40998 RepID=A0A2P7Z647_9PEZI|nr:hypothetical protein B9Z65_7202 [Elsinoe australis]
MRLLVVLSLASHAFGAAVSLTSSASIAASTASSKKRGLAYNDGKYTLPYGKSSDSSQVSWAYNWGPHKDSSSYNAALEFVPLLYNNDASLLASWPSYASQAIANGSTALMSFNEPDLCQDGSACMNVSTSVATYKKYMQPFAGKALLGAPAIVTGDTAYLSDFLGNCTGCTVDFVVVHWYSNVYAGVPFLKSFIEDVRKVAGGRPIWLTEFGFDYTEPYTAAQLQDFLVEAMAYLDSQSDVARYAYFFDAPGFLIDSSTGVMNTLGVLYNNYSSSTGPQFEILSAYVANMDVTTIAKTLVSNNVITIDTSCLECTFGSDPWWGTVKTFSMLYKFGNSTYTFNAVAGSGTYKITSATVGTALGVTPVPAQSATNGAQITVAGVTWGEKSITALGQWNYLYKCAATNCSLYFSDGLFGTDHSWNHGKSGVIWYRDLAGTLKVIAGKEGAMGRFA